MSMSVKFRLVRVVFAVLVLNLAEGRADVASSLDREEQDPRRSLNHNHKHHNNHNNHNKHNNHKHNHKKKLQNHYQATTATTTNLDISPRIVNGGRAPLLRYPFMSAIFNRLSPEMTEYRCGASLVAPNMVLTAGHCADLADVVQVGRRDMYDPHEESGFETFDVDQVLVHPEFNSTSFVYDAALLVLNGTSTQKPLLLNSPSSDFLAHKGQPLTVLGFGAVRTHGVASSTLLETDVIAWSREDCLSSYATPRRLGDFTLCANAQNPTVASHDEDPKDFNDACQGDSGGPLILRRAGLPQVLQHSAGAGDDEEGTHRVHTTATLHDVQVGIVSWGNKCGVPHHPGVYSRVRYLYNWIEENICKHSPTYCGKTAANIVNAANNGHQADQVRVQSPSDQDASASSPNSSLSSSSETSLSHTDGQEGTKPQEDSHEASAQDTTTTTTTTTETTTETTTVACTTEDPIEFVYVDDKKNKRKTLSCEWVANHALKECRRYESFCPMTCGKCPADS